IMGSNAQIAHRRTTKKSNGLRTPAKTVSSINMLKTGIHAAAEVTPSEDAAELEALAAQFTAHFKPTTPEERALGDIAVRNEWLLRRLARLEANYWRLKDHEAKYISELHLDASFVLDSNFSRLQRRIDAGQRN